MAYEIYGLQKTEQHTNSNFSLAMSNAYQDEMADTIILKERGRIDIYDIMNTSIMVERIENRQRLIICGIPSRIENKVVPDIERKTKWKLEKLT